MIGNLVTCQAFASGAVTLDSKHDANPKASNLEEDIVQERRYQHQDDMVLVDVRHGLGRRYCSAPARTHTEEQG